MKLSNLYVVQSVSSGCRRAAVAVRAAAFTLLLGAALPIAAQTAVTSSPYSGVPIAIPGAFEAENFDFGGEGVAYHDNVPGTAGSQYRLGEDVDIIESTDPAGGGYVVNNFEAGEWLAYTINVATSAQYDIELRASNGKWAPPPRFHIEIDGINVTGSILVPNTGSWSTFQWIGKTGVPLTAGQHVLKIVSDQQYFDLNSIRVSAMSAPSPYSGVPIAIPGAFEAENFDFGGEGVAYHDNVPGNAGGQYRLGEDVDIILSTDPAGGGYVVNNFETGEWLAYTINVAASAQYDIEIRASSGFPNSAFHIEIDGINVTGSILVPNTGSWSTFQWIGEKGVALTAGVHVLKVVSDIQYFDLNSIRVVTSGIVPTTIPATIPATVPAAVQALWSAGMEDGTMSAWYAGGGGGEFNGHPGSTAGSVGSDGSTSAASQEQAHSGAWSAKLTIPSNGACRLVRQLESQQYAELYYSAWYYFPQSYTLSGPGAFWMLMQWKSATATAHDPFFMLVAYSATPSTLNLGLAWFPLPVDGPLPGQSGYQLFPSNIQMPVV